MPGPISEDEIVERLKPLAERLEFLFPQMQQTLTQAEMDKSAIDHMAEALYRGASTGVMIGGALLAFGLTSNDLFLVKMTLILAPIGFLFGFFTFAKLPEIKAKKRTRKLEAELPYALRHILIEVESGISLYEAMVSVSEGYGEASKEFKKIVKDINAGTSEIEALEKAVVRNPSMQFRRALWQMINALKSGSDVSTTLNSLVDAIVKKQVLAVRKYGKELNPYTLMYMMIAVIIPSLGVTFLMILSTFTGMAITNDVFYGILVGLIIFQAMFINIVKSKRPQVKA